MVCVGVGLGFGVEVGDLSVGVGLGAGAEDDDVVGVGCGLGGLLVELAVADGVLLPAAPLGLAPGVAELWLARWRLGVADGRPWDGGADGLAVGLLDGGVDEVEDVGVEAAA